jgi:hypothetical protein
MPCFESKSKKHVTFLQNGTLVTFIRNVPTENGTENENWMFHLTSDPDTLVLINSSAWKAGYLWKVKPPKALRTFRRFV